MNKQQTPALHLEDRRFPFRLQNQANDGILYMALPITVGS